MRVNDRGRLLSEMPVDLTEDDKKDLRKVRRRRNLVAVGLVIGAVLPFVLDVGEFAVMLAFMLYYSVLLTGLFISSLSSSLALMRGLQVYENGVMAYPLEGKGRFIGWGFFKFALGDKGPKDPNLLVAGPAGRVKMTDGLPGLLDWIDEVQERVGKSKYRYIDEESQGMFRHEVNRRLGLIALAVPISGLVISFMMYSTTETISRVEPLLLGVIVVSYLATFALPYVMGQTLSVMRGMLTGKSTTSALAVIVVLLIAGYSGFTLGLVSIDPEPFREQWSMRVTPNPRDSVLEPGAHEDQWIVADGPISVQAGETLTLVNTTVIFDPAPGSRWGLWVADGGHLELRGSTIRCVDARMGYDLEVHGSASIVDSEIAGTRRGFSESHGMFESVMDTGFEVHSDDVVFRNTTFIDHMQMGVLTYDCSPLFENCTFLGMENAAGLGIVYGSPMVVDCTFEACFCATWVFDSTAEFRNCTFTGNRNGMYLQYGTPRVIDCVLADTWYIAIYDHFSDPQLENLVLTDNGEDIHVEVAETELELVQAIIMLYTIPVMALIMKSGELISERLRLRKEAEEEFSILDLA